MADHEPAAGTVRVWVSTLADASAGDLVALEAEQWRHLSRVRRLGRGSPVEAFDSTGRRAAGQLGEAAVLLDADPLVPERTGGLTICSAVPKGSRADWMVEKLSELGVERWVPLLTRRSVVEPGAGKLDRWVRLARESAKQSGRAGVMEIAVPTPVGAVVGGLRSSAGGGAQPGRGVGLVLATEVAGVSWPEAVPAGAGQVTVLIGPEGGWEPGELESFESAGLSRVRVAGTVLRVETAAMAAAALWAAGRADERVG